MLRIPYGPDENHFGHLRLPEGAGPHPLLIVIHGGFWRARYDLHHMEEFCERFTAYGLATWNIEYRRIGQPGGGWPGTCDDVLAAVRYGSTLGATHPLDTRRTVAAGYSAGGHLALYAAAHEASLIGAVSLAGVADLALAWDMRLSQGAVCEFLSGLPEQFPEASPANLSITIPQRLVHGDQDESVPIAIARQYTRNKLARGEDVELVEAPDQNHSDLISPAAGGQVKKTILDLFSNHRGN
jgi:acetyl esterase/lipase